MKNFLINTFTFLLILVGALLVGWHFVQDDLILHFGQVDIIPEEFGTNLIETQDLAEFDWDSVTELEWNDLLPYINYEVLPIGELIVPSVGIRLPILQGTSNENVTLGAGTMMPDLVMGQGNYSLTSHWHPNPELRFGGIDLIEVGDLIILRDADYLYIYETIIENYVIEDYRVDITDYVEGKTYITLMTCTPDGYQRVMVRGEFVEQISLVELATASDMLAELEALSNVDDLESIVEVVEVLEHTRIPFPIVSVILATVGPLLLATCVVWFSNRGFKRSEDNIELYE